MKGLKFKAHGYTFFSSQGFDNGDNSNFLKSGTIIIENVKKKCYTLSFDWILFKQNHIKLGTIDHMVILYEINWSKTQGVTFFFDGIKILKKMIYNLLDSLKPT